MIRSGTDPEESYKFDGSHHIPLFKDMAASHGRYYAFDSLEGKQLKIISKASFNN